MAKGIKGSSPICSECEKLAVARGWCWKHYLRWYRHRDPLSTGNRHGHRGGSRSPEWLAWQGMKQRCSNPNVEGWEHYGGRDITVWPGWQNDFRAFLRHIGPRPGSGWSLDRIDSNRGYEPGNVRWATWETQLRNRRDRQRIAWRVGVWLAVEWDDRLGFRRGTVEHRLWRGWSVERVLTQPLRRWPNQGRRP